MNLREEIEEIARQRRIMLATLKGDIATSLYDALAEKIESERAAAEAMLDADAKGADAAARAQILEPRYFVKRTLDASAL